jgi:hypothetical protein
MPHGEDTLEIADQPKMHLSHVDHRKLLTNMYKSVTIHYTPSAFFVGHGTVERFKIPEVNLQWITHDTESFI